MNTTTIVIIAVICVIIAIISLLSYQTKTKSSSNKSSQRNNYVISKTPSTDALPVMNPHHKKVYDLADYIMMWEANDNKYDWLTISESMQLDPDSVKFNFDSCLNCGKHSTILFAFHNSQCVHDNAEKEYMVLCPACKTLFHKDNVSKYCHKDDQEDYVTRLKDELLKINPKFPSLLNILDELGYKMEYFSDFGLYGILRITYREQYLYIFIREDDPIMICYPNWSEIEKTQMNSFELDSIIRSINMSNCISIIWTVNAEKVQLSTFGNIQLGADKANNLASLKLLLDELIKSPHYFEMSQRGRNHSTIRHNERDIETLLNIFEKAGCSQLNVDDEGDISLTYGGEDLMVQLTNEKYIKISHNGGFYHNASEEGNIDDYTGINLVLQWNNIIYPIKCSYFEPSEGIQSITLYIDCNLLPNNEENIVFIKQILPKLINAESMQISDHLLNGSEKALEDINLWCNIEDLQQLPTES